MTLLVKLSFDCVIDVIQSGFCEVGMEYMSLSQCMWRFKCRFDVVDVFKIKCCYCFQLQCCCYL